MTKLLELVERLTEIERREVEDFAEFLLVRRMQAARPEPASQDEPIRYGSWFGCLAHVHPEMSDKEFGRLMEDGRAQEAME